MGGLAVLGGQNALANGLGDLQRGQSARTVHALVDLEHVTITQSADTLVGVAGHG